MLTSMSSGAILSKTRAMFGRRLTEADYTALAAKRDLPSAAAFLAAHPGYADLFEGRGGGDIYRMEFEELLRRRHYRSFESLCRYELSIGEKISEYILLSTEIELITETLSRILSPREDVADIIHPSPFLESKMKVDIPALGRAQTFDELLAAVRDSVFFPVLRRVGSRGDSELLHFENALLGEFYRRVIATVDESLSGRARDELLDIFLSRIDLENLVRIARLRQHFDVPPEKAVPLLLPFGNVTGRVADRLARCRNSGEVLETAARMRPFRGKLADAEECLYLDELPDRYILRRCLHELYFSPHPAVVMISYLYVSQIEVSNIVRIVEGIRYALPPDRIREMLILPRKREGSGEPSGADRMR